MTYSGRVASGAPSGPARAPLISPRGTSRSSGITAGIPQEGHPSPLVERLNGCLVDCAIVDCETTGLDPVSDHIIEIAALRVHDGVPVALFHRLVDPQRPLPPVIHTLTGLNDTILHRSGQMEDVLADLTGFLGTQTVVGHNVRFDLAFIDAASGRGKAAPRGSTSLLCTAEAARELIPRHVVGRYRLATLSEVLGLPHQPRHRAVDDVLATLDLLHHLNALAGGNPSD